MSHYNEHILELYVRNSTDVQKHRAEIEQHLAECNSCRELVQEIREFYTLAEDSKKLLSDSTINSGSVSIEPHIGKYTVSGSYISNSFPARLVRFAKQRPITSSLFTFGFIVISYFSLNSIISSNDRNPLNYKYNEKNNSLIILDKYDSLLWEKKIQEDASSLIDVLATTVIYRTVIADIDHDGINDITTILRFISDEVATPQIRVLDGNGKTKNTFSIPFHKIQYKTKHYQTNFFPSSLEFGGNTGNTLFASANNGRSPTVILRYDGSGNLLGSYWHFGHLTVLLFDADLDGNVELILNGINDTEDETKRSFACTIILDPEKIVGNCESSATPGFGLPVSEAELYYIRYSIPEVLNYSISNLVAVNSTNKDEKYVRVLNRARLEHSAIAIEYFFDSTFTVKDVKFDTGMLITHNQLYKEGKLKNPMNEQYIKSLKDAVMYWDGSNWVNKPTRINRQISLQ